MKKNSIALLLALAIGNAAAIELKTEEQKLSYALGVDMTEQLLELSDKNDINMEALQAGMRDSFEGKERALSEEESDKVMEAFAQKQMKKMEEELAQQKAKMEKLGEEAKVAGAKFLEENKGKEGVKVTASGLQYKVEKEGTGDKPSATDEVTVNYTGKTIDGKVFDSSENEPITFPLSDVIAGWTEGLQLMNKGAKYTFFIPSQLAYGEEGMEEDIPPHSVLIFDVELIDFHKAGEAKAEAKASDDKAKVEEVKAEAPAADAKATEAKAPAADGAKAEATEKKEESPAK